MQIYTNARRLDDIDWTTWRAVHPATLVFIVSGTRILLIRKKTGLGAGKINGPGGKLDPGETLEQCAVRECQEELQVTPMKMQHCGRNLFQFVDGYSIDVHCYRADQFSGTPTETREAAPIWVSVDAIPYDEMWEDDRLWLPRVLDREPFFARYIFDGDKMLDYDLADA